MLLLMFTVSSLSTVAENVDVYDVSISYGTYNGSNLLVIVAVMNSFCPFHFLRPSVRRCRRSRRRRRTCPPERVIVCRRRRRCRRPLCPLLMPDASYSVRDVGSGQTLILNIEPQCSPQSSWQNK